MPRAWDKKTFSGRLYAREDRKRRRKKHRKINWVKHPRTEKRAGEWCHGSWERLVPCYWVPERVQSLISSLSAFFPFKRALESFSEVSSRWECMARQTGAKNGQGWVKQLPLSLSDAQKWRTQRSKGPVAQSSSQASLRSLQPGRSGNWRREAGYPGWRLTTKAAEKSIHTWKKESNIDTYFKR